jgi:C-terminal processing protease CtpA/Prc
MDMVGRLDEYAQLHGVGSSPAWAGEIERANVAVGLSISVHDDAYLPTDATAFYVKGIPVLTAFTGPHEDYHTPGDTPDKLDYDGMERIARLFAAMAGSLADQPELPAYVTQPRPERGTRAGLRAYLGTIPAYTQSEQPGLELSGVAPDGPAARAGLRQGDLITRLAGRKVENVYDYTYAIDALKIGTPVEVTLIRNGKELTLEITPESRD